MSFPLECSKVAFDRGRLFAVNHSHIASFKIQVKIWTATRCRTLQVGYCMALPGPEQGTAGERPRTPMSDPDSRYCCGPGAKVNRCAHEIADNPETESADILCAALALLH